MMNYPWYSKYPKGTPQQIGPLEYNSLIELFDAAAHKYPNRVAFENFGKQITFAEIDRLSTAFAAYLQNELKLKKGDRVAIQMPNLIQFPIAFMGVIKAGLIAVNTNPLYTPREMEHQFNDAGVSAIVIVSNFAHNLEQILPKLKSKPHIILTDMGDMVGGLKGVMVSFVVKHIKKMVPAFSLPTSVSFKSALKRGENSSYKKPDIQVEDLAVLQYTGGTTGVSKGAQLSHRNIIAHNAMITHWFKPIITEGQQDIVITALPLYHIFALTVNGLLMYTQGVKSVLITNPRDIPGFVKELKKHRFSIITGVNTLFNGLLNNPDFKDCDFSALKGAIGGAMAVQDVVADKWEKLTGCPLIEGYGLSETSPVLCCNPLDGNHKRGTIGIPMPGTEIGIFDDDGNQLPQGEVGEICARGPQVMRGYWNQNNEGVFFKNDWFRTGDIGVMDTEGYFKIVDRKKDMIKVSGFNVYPNEIENVLSGHPKVMEVAAIGVSDAKSGEAIKVFVVKKDESLTEEELKKYAHENLTNYKVPRHFEFKKELPKTNVGKILRRALKEAESVKTT
ncbi:MAG TPA: AMP-binding protein [Cyclobacteriaceae bacterium]|nr:AMP-binding protein [Cytophagales bacterium]HNT50192.1 AMP-binding protein [Cyclobacteriaceae bacterium]HRE66964.1 AMP-binding protein [Cyclobacteriaceae bacterium]HRF33138.1 AMP-binding protein [Cyclobacteriaceae bacterium]